MDVLSGALWAIGTVVVLVLGLGIAGFVVLFRRRGDAIALRGSGSFARLTARGGSLLVRLDDRVRDADDEVGYAIAQFGEDRAREFAEALAFARGRLAEAFRLRQALDDAHPDSPREQREWTLQIIALCEQADARLDAQEQQFRALRADEANAPGTLQDLTRRLADLRGRGERAAEAVAALGERFAPTALGGIQDNPARADRLLATAESDARTAGEAISASGVNAVTDRLGSARAALQEADRLLDAVDRVGADLTTAEETLKGRRARVRADLGEARAAADRAPDPETARAILDAIARVDAVEPSVPADPLADLDRLEGAVAGLDLALASARNQADRLRHAREAYEGTLVAARSQIAVARELVGRGGVGVDARTRLAEAERQLALAQAETDPVAALDTVRRAVTHARDADALARYDRSGRP